MDFKKIGTIAILFVLAVAAKSFKDLSSKSQNRHLVIDALLNDKETFEIQTPTNTQSTSVSLNKNNPTSSVQRVVHKQKNSNFKNNKRSWSKKFSNNIVQKQTFRKKPVKSKSLAKKIADKKKKKKASKVEVKKKKVKKEIKDGETKPEELFAENDFEELPTEENNDLTQNNFAVAGAAIAINTDNTNFNGGGNSQRSLEDWLAILLKSPSFKETDRFINFFKLRQVDPSIYFAVVDEMLNDSRKDMQSLGVRLLTAAPSAESFIHLHEISTSDSTLRDSAVAALRQYQDIRSLEIMKSLFLSEATPSDIRISALAQLQIITRNTVQSDSDVNTFTTKDEQGTFINPQATALSTLPLNVQSVLNNSTDNELIRRAQDFARDLETIFGPLDTNQTPIASN